MEADSRRSQAKAATASPTGGHILQPVSNVSASLRRVGGFGHEPPICLSCQTSSERAMTREPPSRAGERRGGLAASRTPTRKAVPEGEIRCHGPMLHYGGNRGIQLTGLSWRDEHPNDHYPESAGF